MPCFMQSGGPRLTFRRQFIKLDNVKHCKVGSFRAPVVMMEDRQIINSAPTPDLLFSYPSNFFFDRLILFYEHAFQSYSG